MDTDKHIPHRAARNIANNYTSQQLEDFLSALASELDAIADRLDKTNEDRGTALHSTAQSLWDATASWATRTGN